MKVYERAGGEQGLRLRRPITKRPANLTEKLHELGLTKQEAKIYDFLVGERKSTAGQISLSLRIPVQAVYRSCYNLNRLGFVGLQKTRPMEFIATPEKLSVPTYIKSKQDIFNVITRDILSAQRINIDKVSPTKVSLVFGEKEMFQSGIGAFNKARYEILVISIGQELPQELMLAQKNAVARGVKSLMIAHKSNKENRQVLASFKSNGIEVRHFPDWGFHLVIVDSFYVMVAANNPKNTKERVGIEFYNESLCRAMRDYFYTVWEKAKPI